MKVTNRSDSQVVYSIEELKVRRLFAPNETKEIQPIELEALFQMAGGAELIKHHLLIEDKEWVKKHWEAPIEYFWNREDIIKCVKDDSLDMFSETLDYAPQGILEIIKTIAWQLPLTDLNKINVIKQKLGFDVQAAIAVMSTSTASQTPVRKERLRQRKET